MLTEKEIFEDIEKILIPNVREEMTDTLARKIHEYYKLYVLPDNEYYCKHVDEEINCLNPYQKYIDAENDKLKVVQYLNIDGVWRHHDNFNYELPPNHYRIMQYVPFDNDVNELIGKQIIAKELSIFLITGIFIDEDDAYRIRFNGDWYSSEEVFNHYRFYDPNKDKFEDMPIFGKLVEVKE